MFGHFPEDILSEFKEAYAERQAMAVGYPMPSFADKADLPCNKPQAEAQGNKSHVVKACYDGAPQGGKLIRFGQKGVKGSPPKEGESESYKARREAWFARHKKNIDKGPSSAAYWAAKTKW